MAVLFFASSFYLIYHATESRMYSLMLVAGLGSTLATWRLLQRPSDRRQWWWYVAWSVIGVYTQYLYWLLLAAQTMTVCTLGRLRRTRLPIRRWLLAQLGVLVAFLPWLPIMLGRLAGKSSQLTWMHGLPLGQKLLTIALDPVVPINPISNIIGVSSWRAWVLLAALASLFFFVDIRVSRTALGLRLRHDWPTPALFLAGLILLPPLIGSLVGSWFARYFMATIALLAIAYARWLTGPRARHFQTAAAAVLFAGMAAANWYFFLTVFRYDIAFRWPAVAAAVGSAREPSEAIFFAAAEERLEFLYFYGGALPVTSFLPRDLRRGNEEVDRLRVAGLPIATADNVGGVTDDLAPYSSLWFIHGPSVLLVDPQRHVERWVMRHCQPKQALVFNSSAGVGVWQEIVATRYAQCFWDFPLRPGPWSSVSTAGIPPAL